MTASGWIALLLGGPGIGLLTTGVARITRLVLAVENLAKAFQGLSSTVADHEKRLKDGGL